MDHSHPARGDRSHRELGPAGCPELAHDVDVEHSAQRRCDLGGDRDIAAWEPEHEQRRLAGEMGHLVASRRPASRRSRKTMFTPRGARTYSESVSRMSSSERRMRRETCI